MKKRLQKLAFVQAFHVTFLPIYMLCIYHSINHCQGLPSGALNILKMVILQENIFFTKNLASFAEYHIKEMYVHGYSSHCRVQYTYLGI